MCGEFGDLRLLSTDDEIVCEQCRVEEFYQIHIKQTLPNEKPIVALETNPSKLNMYMCQHGVPAHLRDCSKRFGTINAPILIEISPPRHLSKTPQSPTFVIKNDDYLHTADSAVASVLTFYKRHGISRVFDTPTSQIALATPAWAMIKYIKDRLAYPTVEPIRRFELFDSRGKLNTVEVDSKVSEHLFLSAYLSDKLPSGTSAASVCGWDEYMIYKAICKSIYGGDAQLKLVDISRAISGRPLRWRSQACSVPQRDIYTWGIATYLWAHRNGDKC